jgi:signal transduction histidine kinase
MAKKFVYLQDRRVRWAYLLLAAFVNLIWFLIEMYFELPFDYLVMRAFITISFCASYLFLRVNGTDDFYQQAILLNSIFHQSCYFLLFAWSGSSVHMVSVCLAMVLAPIAFEMTWKNSTILNVYGLIALNALTWPSEMISTFELASVNILYIAGMIYTLNSRGLFIKIANENNAFQSQTQIERDKLDERNKELIEANRIKSKFLSVLSHDIRTPLNDIRSMMHISSSRHKLTVAERQCVEFQIVESIDSTVELLDKIIEWSEYQVGATPAQPVNINLFAAVEKAFHVYGRIAESKKVKLVNAISPEMEIVIDPSIFGLVLRNLIGHAVKFTKLGTVSVECSTSGKAVQIKVCGISMPEGTLSNNYDSNVFELANEKGFALGLMLSKQFLARIGGSITYGSNPSGDGIEFSFSIPQPVQMNRDTINPESLNNVKRHQSLIRRR